MDNLVLKIPKPKVEHIKVLEVKKIVIPHPYCITPKHLLPDEMYLTKETLKRAEEENNAVCDICRKEYKDGKRDKILSVDEHKEQNVLFLEVPKTENLNDVEGLNEYLKEIKPILEELKIDGIGFKQIECV